MRGCKGVGPLGPCGPTFRLALCPSGPPGQEAVSKQRLFGVLVLCAQDQGAEQLCVVGRAAVVEHVRQLQRLRAAPMSEHLHAGQNPGGEGRGLLGLYAPRIHTPHPITQAPIYNPTHTHTPRSLGQVPPFPRAAGTSAALSGSGIFTLNPHALAPVPRRPLPGFAYLSHVTMDVFEDSQTRVLAWALFITIFFKVLII